MNLSSDPLFDPDADPGLSFFDWILHAHVGVHDANVMRTHYRHRIPLLMRDPARPRPSSNRSRSTRPISM
jgi:hypothetical protein